MRLQDNKKTYGNVTHMYVIYIYIFVCVCVCVCVLRH